MRNPLTQIDFYKAGHRQQYPEGTELVYSNFTPRSDRLSNLPYPIGTVFFGLQYFIIDYLIEEWNEGFFWQPKKEVVDAYSRRMKNSLGEDVIPVDHIEALHDLGYLPLEIRAVKEGTTVKNKVPMLTIHNTKPEFFWLVNYIETVLSCTLWKACVSATTAKWYRKNLDYYADLTGSNPETVNFQAHDFSMRGMSGREDAAVSGAAHLLSFWGTDTVSAIDFLEEFYGADSDVEPIGFSVPATEHSVMCMGTKDDEIGTFRRLVTELYPKGIVSIVSDTWDFWKVLTDYLPILRQEILTRDGKVVIRPDSGDPVKVIGGYIMPHDIVSYTSLEHAMENAAYDLTEAECVNIAGEWFECGWLNEDDWEVDFLKPLTEAEIKGAVELLWCTFGGETNEKGFKELDEHIGLIYGDSITPQRSQEILSRLRAKGFASSNVVFGVGSFTYQMVTRDTAGFAVKATAGIVNGEVREIFKDPVTDKGTKKSARGFLKVEDGVLYDQQPNMDELGDMDVVFKDGELLREQTLSEIREILKCEKPEQ